jgi:hypothetical protein
VTRSGTSDLWGTPARDFNHSSLLGELWLATVRRQLLPWLHQLFFSHPPPLTPTIIIEALVRALRVK